MQATKTDRDSRCSVQLTANCVHAALRDRRDESLPLHRHRALRYRRALWLNGYVGWCLSERAGGRSGVCLSNLYPHGTLQEQSTLRDIIIRVVALQDNPVVHT